MSSEIEKNVEIGEEANQYASKFLDALESDLIDLETEPGFTSAEISDLRKDLYVDIAADYLNKNHPSVNAEIFTNNEGDEAFIVIGRDKDSNLSDPSTWGSSAVLCDSLSDEISKSLNKNPDDSENSSKDVSKKLNLDVKNQKIMSIRDKIKTLQTEMSSLRGDAAQKIFSIQDFHKVKSQFENRLQPNIIADDPNPVGQNQSTAHHHRKDSLRRHLPHQANPQNQKIDASQKKLIQAKLAKNKLAIEERRHDLDAIKETKQEQSEATKELYQQRQEALKEKSEEKPELKPISETKEAASLNEAFPSQPKALEGEKSEYKPRSPFEMTPKPPE